MTPLSHTACLPNRCWRGRAAAVAALVGSALAMAACGGSSVPAAPLSPAAATTVLVKPPDLPLRGCDYVVNGVVPAGATGGTPPPFTLSGPDRAAVTALAHIGRRSGTALVSGYTLPSGVELYAGPDAGATAVATIPSAHSVFVADPVLWTTSSGAHWLASFMACGGRGLYWIDVAQIGKVNAAVGRQVIQSIATLEAAAPYPGSGKASSLPITITHGLQFAWVDPAVKFAIGRGQYLGF